MTSVNVTLVADLGTFCDQSLVAGFISAELASRRILNVHHVTDRRNPHVEALSSRFGTGRYVARTFDDCPSFMFDRETTWLADPTRSASWWAMRHPSKAFGILQFLSALEDLLRKEAPSADRWVIGYPLMAVAIRVDVPWTILAYAPVFPNATLPWPFDGRIEALTRLYHTSPAFAIDSHQRYYARLSAQSGVAAAECRCRLASWTFLDCAWPLLRGSSDGKGPKVQKVDDIFTVNVVHGNLHVHELPGGLPASLQRKRGRRIVYVTFGSYLTKEIRRAAAALRPTLAEFAARSGSTIAYAKRVFERDAEKEVVVDEYIPYSKLVPRCSLVVFTGSLCLQAACARSATPMLLVPLLTEQRFWALNLKQAFVDVHDLDASIVRVREDLLQLPGEFVI